MDFVQIQLFSYIYIAVAQPLLSKTNQVKVQLFRKWILYKF